MTALHGVELPPIEPGSPEWLTTISASKIAAIVGLSPYESPFSMWHKMAGNVTDTINPEYARRGHALEPVVCQWFADNHPDWQVSRCPSYAHPDQPLFTASPDRTVWLPDGTVGLLEAKTSAYADDWGAPGTDAIPPGYRAQVVWQMGVTGATRCYVQVLIGMGLTFAEYVVDFEPEEFDYLAKQATAFLATLPGGSAERIPAIDDSSATYEAVRALHPEIADEDIEVPAPTVDRFEAAHDALKAAETEFTGAKSELLDAMSGARRALLAGRIVARRQPSKYGVSLVRVAAKEAAA